jgi:hypothetical protein
MALKSLSTAELQKELERRQKNAHKLLARREKLLAELAEVEKELSFFGVIEGGANAKGSSSRSADAGTGRRRAKNAMTLPDAICSAMEIRAVVSPKEASELVRANGFKTTSKNFNMMVSNALAKDERFKRVGRGQYERIG